MDQGNKKTLEISAAVLIIIILGLIFAYWYSHRSTSTEVVTTGNSTNGFASFDRVPLASSTPGSITYANAPTTETARPLSAQPSATTAWIDNSNTPTGSFYIPASTGIPTPLTTNYSQPTTETNTDETTQTPIEYATSSPFTYSPNSYFQIPSPSKSATQTQTQTQNTASGNDTNLLQQLFEMTPEGQFLKQMDVTPFGSDSGGGGGGGMGGLGGLGGGGGGGGGGSQSFGGDITKITRCTCGPSSLLDINDKVTNGTVSLLYTPGQSQLYANYNTNKTGANVIGLYSSGGECKVLRGTYCVSEGNPKGTITKIGTSQ